MRGDVAGDSGLTQRVHGKPKDASFQVIVLGASGGPREDTCTGLLVRAPQSEWRKGSMIAVDAGVHLSSIVRILQQQMPLYSDKAAPTGYSKVLSEGPFAGVRCKGYSARSNALHIFRELLHAFLITHPHLDHLAALGINTPALEYGREAKTIVALDSTIEAIKNHIFNDAIWPNLSDEGSGVGFVTYRRLKEGGNIRLGSGDARGYVRVCDTLATLCMPVTHGKCKSKPTPVLHSRSESAGWHDPYAYHSQRRLSRISDHDSYFAAVASQSGHNPPISSSHFHAISGPTTPGYPPMHTPNLSAIEADHFEAVKSSAFFILNEETSQEILIFGDIEPDAVSVSPQNYKVWKTAASKVANGVIKAMFIECSYDDSVRDQDLYGHLCPRHLIQELLFLGKEVAEYKAQKKATTAADVPQPSIEAKRTIETPVQAERKSKRKRLNGDGPDSEVEMSPAMEAVNTASLYVGTRSSTSRRKPSITNAIPTGDISPVALRAISPLRTSKHVHFSGPQSQYPSIGSVSSPTLSAVASPYPPLLNIQSATNPATVHTENGYAEKPPDAMKGLTIHIIHVKDTLVDGPSPGTIISQQLNAHAAEAGLECTFDVTDFGESIWI